MSRSLRVPGLGVAVLAFVGVACGGPNPPPAPTASDGVAASAAPSGALPSDGGPSGTPGPSGQPGSSPEPGASPPPAGAPAADLVAPVPQPALPGLYLPAGTLAQGSDHYALIQARMDCEALTAALGAGQWQIVDRAALAIPTPDPAASAPPMPELTPFEWILLRWGDEAAMARVGGDENGCIAQVWRLARLPYAATGAIESAGEAQSLQMLCVAGGGVAQIASIHVADDGTLFSVSTQVPLERGTHPITMETELSAGQAEVDVEMFFRGLYGQQPGGDGEAIPDAAEPYFPADFEAGAWEGSIEVTSVEPLTGEIVFRNVRNEDGDALELRTGFRCDLPPGQLARAAEQSAEATPGPDATPTPAPGQVTVQIASGPHAGSHTATSADATCSANLFGDGKWHATYSQAEPIAGDLQSLTLTVPADGQRTDVFMIFGDDFERDWFNTDDATTEITDDGSSVTFDVTGRDAGTEFEIEFVCYDIARF